MGEINRKLQRFKLLPVDTDPAISLVLEAQREKIRVLAAEIDEGEHSIEVQRLALDYVDKRVDGQGADPELLNTAITMAKGLRQARYDEELGKAKKEMSARHAAMQLTTEEEVNAVEAKCLAVAAESGVAVEADRQKALGPALSAPGISVRGGAPGAREELAPPPRLPIPLRNAGKEKARLLQRQKRLREDLDGIERRAEELKGWLRNGEQTAKSLEEIKTLFLLRIAREQPKLLGDDYEVANQGELTPSCAGSSESEKSDSEPQEASRSEAMAALSASTQRLQEQLRKAEAALNRSLARTPHGSGLQRPKGRAVTVGAPRASLLGSRRASASLSRSQTESLPNNPDDHGITIALREAALTVSRAAQHGHREAAGDGAQELDDSAQAQTSAEETQAAARHLRSRHCGDLREALRLRVRNAELEGLVDEAAERLDRLREERGSPGMALGAASPGHRYEVEGAEASLVAEVMLKRRELLALRRRWWSERQDPKTMARRAHAGVELGGAEADEPPKQLQGGSSFDRIRASMTRM